MKRERDRERMAAEVQRDQEQPNQAQLLIRLVHQDVEVYRTTESSPYVSFQVNGHRENHPVTSAAFQQWLKRRFYHQYGKPPNKSVVEAVVDLFSAEAAQADVGGGEKVGQIGGPEGARPP